MRCSLEDFEELSIVPEPPAMASLAGCVGPYGLKKGADENPTVKQLEVTGISASRSS